MSRHENISSFEMLFAQCTNAIIDLSVYNYVHKIHDWPLATSLFY